MKLKIGAGIMGIGTKMSLIRFIEEFVEIRKHNATIEKQWRKNGCPIVATTIGWRPDPWQNEDGMKNNGDGSYSRLIRGGTDEYRKQFADDVEKASTEWME